MSALSEDFQDRIGGIAEQFVDLKTDINGLKKDVTGIKKDVSSLKQDMAEVKQTLDSHTKMLDSHTKILDSHTAMLGQLMVDATETNINLKTKVSQNDFAKLDERVVKLES